MAKRKRKQQQRQDKCKKTRFSPSKKQFFDLFNQANIVEIIQQFITIRALLTLKSTCKALNNALTKTECDYIIENAKIHLTNIHEISRLQSEYKTFKAFAGATISMLDAQIRVTFTAMWHLYTYCCNRHSDWHTNDLHRHEILDFVKAVITKFNAYDIVGRLQMMVAMANVSTEATNLPIILSGIELAEYDSSLIITGLRTMTLVVEATAHIQSIEHLVKTIADYLFDELQKNNETLFSRNGMSITNIKHDLLYSIFAEEALIVYGCWILQTQYHLNMEECKEILNDVLHKLEFYCINFIDEILTVLM